ncbi:hypothetical protein C8J26_2583 [Sphingomonas aurantiaca]|uniref:Uncharacterized protein n=1 Tax=Sphingomonas aurantiaca TaxID=185949 RepID=A0A2T5GKA2_9SPHN|nr:hypothetical protein [Sphingomonas aurantiaca]PTQ59731.1 hypothetical protein C8J26_2583 [Sphingomonas aurantiaca]
MAGFSFAAGILPSGATVTRAAGPYSFTGSNGLTQFGSAANVARFDFDPVTLACRGLLLEPPRTNYIVSDAATIPLAQNIGSTWVANTGVAPDGTTTADRLVNTNANTSHGFVLNASSSRPAGPLTLSAFAQVSGLPRFGLRAYDGAKYFHRGTFDLTTGTVGALGGVGTAAIVSYGSGRYRCSTSGTSAAAVQTYIMEAGTSAWTVQQTSQGDGVSGVYVSGVQLEDGLVATSFIPAPTAPATRPGETLSLNWAPQGVTDGLYSVLYTFADGTMQPVQQQVTGGVSTISPASLNSYTIRSVSILQTPASRTISLGDKAPRSATLVDTGSRSATILT